MLYIEYEKYKTKLYNAQQDFDSILSEQEKLFSRTQPQSTDFGKEPTKGGVPSDKFYEYVKEKEEKQIDLRLTEARSILNDRERLTKLKLEELLESKNIYDKVYVCKYIEGLKNYQIAKKISYSEAQIYRILKIIRKNINMIENERKIIVK